MAFTIIAGIIQVPGGKSRMAGSEEEGAIHVGKG